MGKANSEVSILVTAKDQASTTVKKVASAAVESAKKAAQSTSEITKQAELAEKALKKMGVNGAALESAMKKMGFGAKAAGADIAAGAAGVQKLGDVANKTASGVHALAAGMSGDVQAVEKWRTSLKSGESTVHGMTAALSGNKAAFEQWRSSVQNATTAVHPMMALLTQGTSGTAKYAEGTRRLQMQQDAAAKTAAELVARQTALKEAFKNFASEIPFASRGIELFKTLIGSTIARIIGIGAAFAGIGIAAVKAAEHIQGPLLIMRNQIPGVSHDMHELHEIIGGLAKADPLGRTAEEIAKIGLVLSRNGTGNAEQFARNLELVLKASAASGESADSLAEGIDLLSDAFQLKGDALAGTFAKIVNAANGLVPLPDLFQALGRGSTALEAMGVSAETAAAAITSFADAGIPNREAGLAFVRVLEQLTDIQAEETAEAKKAALGARALGIDLSEAHIKAVGLPKVLEEIRDKSGESTKVLKLLGFTTKEATAIIRGKFTPSLEDAAEAEARLTVASQGVGESMHAAWGRLKNTFNVALEDLGTHILPVVIAGLNSLNNLMQLIFGPAPGRTRLDVFKDSVLDFSIDYLKSNNQGGQHDKEIEKLIDVRAKRQAESAKKTTKALAEKAREEAEATEKAVREETARVLARKQLEEINAPKLLNPAQTRDDPFDPKAKKEVDPNETKADRALRLVNEAQNRKDNEEKAKKAIADQIELIETRIKLGRDDAKDHAKLDAIEQSTLKKLENQKLSVEQRLDLEQTLGRIQGIKNEGINTEIQLITQRAEMGKSLVGDADRLLELYNDAKRALESQNLSASQQIEKYQLMLALLQAMAKVPPPSALAPDRNIVFKDSTRQGATAEEQQTQTDAANKPENNGSILAGRGGNSPRAQSDLTEARAEAAKKAIDGAKKSTDEFGQAMNDAIAGPLAEFFKTLTKGFKDFGDVAKAALNSIADAIINIFSQKAAQGIANSLFPEEQKDPLLRGPEGKAALEDAKAQAEAQKNLGKAAAVAPAILPEAVSPLTNTTAQVVQVQATQAVVNAPSVNGDIGGAQALLGGGGGAEMSAVDQSTIAIQAQVGQAQIEAAGSVAQAGNTLQKSSIGLGDAVGLLGAAALAIGGLKKGKVGGLLGGIAGFVLGGPGGASVGAGIGSQLGFADGGVAGGAFFAGAGMVRGPGGPRDDGVAAWLSNGEGVLTARATSMLGGESAINYLNQQALRGGLRIPKFADGGVAGAAVKPGRSEVALTLPPGVEGSVRSNDDVLRVVVHNRRVLRDLFADDN